MGAVDAPALRVATLADEPLYRAFGFEEAGRAVVTTPDGIDFDAVAMQRAIDVA